MAGYLLNIILGAVAYGLWRSNTTTRGMRPMLTKSKGFDPNDPVQREILTKTDAPHEPAAVLRAQRAGYRGSKLAEVVRIRVDRLEAALTTALSDEGDAHRAGRPIHGK